MKKLFFLVFLVFMVNLNTFSMHIMEGFLPVSWTIFWWALTIPFFIYGIISIKKIVKKDSKNILFIVMAGAFCFVLSALKLPSVTGSCSHPTGTGFGAIIFGPSVMFILGFIVLLFQALLLAHGGLTTLGANNFSMGIAGPIVAFIIYKLFVKLRVNKFIAIFFAAFLGDLITYVVTSVQLSLAYPDANGGILASFLKFASIFALTQIPLAVVEGLLTVLIINVLLKYAKTELSQFDFSRNYSTEKAAATGGDK